MKKISFLILISICGFSMISAGCFAHRLHAEKKQRSENNGNDDAAFTAREEINETYQFAPNADVEVDGINGSVDVQTVDGTNAEVHIVRLAKNKDVFERRKAVVSFEANKLKISGNRRNENSGIWDLVTGDDDLKTRVTLKLPRKVNLETSGVNGRVNIGEIDGRVEVQGVNGKVQIAKATGSSRFSGINGGVDATISKLDKDAIEIHGVNGNVALSFLEDVNANVEVHGINGRVNVELPNVKEAEQNQKQRQNYRATIGTGGPEIQVSGMNGNLWLKRAGNVASKAPQAITSPALKAIKAE